MKLSLITVVRNTPQVADALHSVRTQVLGRHTIEHILVDGASTDGTLAILEAHQGQIACLISEPDQGIYDAMNKGLRQATGEAIGFLNADDAFAHSGVVARILDTLEHPGIQVCYGDLVYVRRSEPDRVVRYWRSEPFRPGLFARGWIPGHSTFYARREVYDRLGGFSLEHSLASDVHFMARALEVERFQAEYIPEVLVRMRTGGASNHSPMAILRANLQCQRIGRELRLGFPWYYIPAKLGRKIPQLLRRSGA